MRQIAIVYFSRYGHTKKLAEAIQEGAQEEQTTSTLYAISQQGNLSESMWQAISQADAIIYGSPTYAGGPAWQFKRFADTSTELWFNRAWQDKIAAGFTNSTSINGDKVQTLNYLFTFAQQHGQCWVGLDLLPSNTKANMSCSDDSIGLMAVSYSDTSPEKLPCKSDVLTAKALGKRVAIITKRFK